MTVAVLLDRVLQGVFNEPDASRRQAVIVEVFAEDGCSPTRR